MASSVSSSTSKESLSYQEPSTTKKDITVEMIFQERIVTTAVCQSALKQPAKKEQLSLKKKRDNYKTQLCRHFIKSRCYRGESCKFAHGSEELRQRPNYKTQLCVNYLQGGVCQFGDDCDFAHGPEELVELPRETQIFQTVYDRRFNASK